MSKIGIKTAGTAVPSPAPRMPMELSEEDINRGSGGVETVNSVKPV
jgi:hypothetical protein